MKDLNVATGRWWRWARYEIRDGYIRPARGAKLRVYDPWREWLKTRPPATSSNRRTLPETPYGSLLALSGELEYRQPGDVPLDFKPGELNMMLAPLTADSEAKLLGWCASYGLLGVLPHCAVQVTLSPGTGVQTRYTKIGAGWIASEQQITSQQRSIPPGAILQPLRGSGLVTESLSATWSRFFPDVPRDRRETFPYPEPLTKEFWERYAEPPADFLSGMRALREFHLAVSLFQERSATARRLQKLQAAVSGGQHLTGEGLINGVGLALEWDRARHVHPKWVASSLLASLATMMLQDLAHGRALQCPGCGRAFVSGAYQARFCSERCRWVVQKREYRESHEPSK